MATFQTIVVCFDLNYAPGDLNLIVKVTRFIMNLLPKTSEEFATKEYWNKFFQKRGKSAFDW